MNRSDDRVMISSYAVSYTSVTNEKLNTRKRYTDMQSIAGMVKYYPQIPDKQFPYPKFFYDLRAVNQ